jgi:hypothetical protein
LRHHEPRLLAARQHAARFSTSSPEKPKQPASVRSEPWPACGKRILQRLEHGAVAVEQLHRVLREVAHLDARADAPSPSSGSGRAGDQLQQRRLAGAVDAHHAPALLAAHHGSRALVDARCRSACARSSRFATSSPERGGGEVERTRLRRFGGSTLDLVELLDAALHLRGVARRAP